MKPTTTADIIEATNLPSWAIFTGDVKPAGHSFARPGLVAMGDVEPVTRAAIAEHVPPLPTEVRVVGDIPGLTWNDKDGRYPSATYKLHTADPRSGDAFDVFAVGWAIRGVNAFGVVTLECIIGCSLFEQTFTIDTGISIEPAMSKEALDAILRHLVVAVSSDDPWGGVDIRPQWVRKGAARGIRAALASGLGPEPATLPAECLCGTVMAGDPPSCEHHGTGGPQGNLSLLADMARRPPVGAVVVINRTDAALVRVGGTEYYWQGTPDEWSAACSKA